MGKASFIIILKKKFISNITIILLAAILSLVLFRCIEQNAVKVFSNGTERIPIAQNGLEPQIPQDLDDPPYYSPPMPSEVFPVSDVIAKGKEITLDFIYNNPDWKRKAYKDYWHSKYMRWSFVPERLHYAMHRIFTTYPTASVYYDFIHDLGIAEESQYFKRYLPMPKNKSQKVNPYQKIEVVVMQTDVKKIKTYGNQIVLFGSPKRTGLQALVIPTDDITPLNADENILFQLATSEGDEIDYSIIRLAKFIEN